jgi:hypothetical protein
MGATPTETPTGTVTLPVTPGVTPIPTETPPPPLQSAEYVYDGDGNMVKAVVNDVVTYYPGRHYNEKVNGSTSTVKKFYTMGSNQFPPPNIWGRCRTAAEGVRGAQHSARYRFSRGMNISGEF